MDVATAPEPMSSKRATRDVEVSAVQDLLDHPPRATVAFVHGDAVDLLPVRARCSAGQYLFGVGIPASSDLADREVVLILDDGPYWFELRGISVRGVASRRAAPAEAKTAGFVWYAIAPSRVLAWDYASVREE